MLAQIKKSSKRSMYYIHAEISSKNGLYMNFKFLRCRKLLRICRIKLVKKIYRDPSESSIHYFVELGVTLIHTRNDSLFFFFFIARLFETNKYNLK